ncbi:MAG: thiamine pyrophosphate-dependent dehydrogenase E1 component subunit alpha [Anaerolineales bacterium]|nr:thiamine pyrophosphate-dependent dehydrogenase E1 component subunit alpha [Anaerolineales bacterium]
MDTWMLYSLMKKSRQFENIVAELWKDGLISGEMHLGTGEEAIIAGVVSQLRTGDAMALDHRGTAAFLMRGVDPILLLREMLGRPDGLCCGQGGHMHLFSKEYLAASSGIVGSSGPAAAGFALAAQFLRPNSIAVAFFGEGAMNQGMLMESINLAAVWNLPVLFVCKDDNWAITTQSSNVTCGSLGERVRGLGVRYVQVDGLDVGEVWKAAHQAMDRVRNGKGPSCLHARCVHPEGHFLGFLLLRIIRDPLRELPGIAIPLMRSFLRPGGGSLRERIAGLQHVLSSILATVRDLRRQSSNDPLVRTRTALASDPARLEELDKGIEEEIAAIVAAAMREAAA